MVQLIIGHTELALVLAGLAVAITCVPILIRKGRPDLATNALVIILATPVFGLMWTYKGLHDEAMLAIPALILFSAVVGSRWIFVAVTVSAIITVFLIGLANTTGVYIHQLQPGNLYTAAMIIVILMVTSFAVWVFAEDMRATMERLSREIHRVNESQFKIRELAHHDALTSLPNRLLAREQFEHALAVSQRTDTKVCLMFMDLDDFKNVNDSFGHQGGDEFLQETAQRLISTVRTTDCVSRLGGDEFLIILESVDDAELMTSVASKILQEVKKPVAIGDSDIVVTASIGIAIAPDDGEDFDTICRQADIAMYHTKDSGRNNYHFFNEAMHQRVQDRLNILSYLHEGLSKRQFELYYQPKIDLATGRIIGAEALIRWHHPVRGLITPDDFIPVAEQSGLIEEMGTWVVEEACRYCKQCEELGLIESDFTMAVNISPVQFSRGAITEVVDEALKKNGLAAQRLELELTESLLIDNSASIKRALLQLRKLGVELAIDDFGTGYSNLGYLKAFQVGVLKIDRSFISKILEAEQSRILVEAIIQVASRLNIKVVAEGVESQQMAEALFVLGCDQAQGFHWTRPLNAMKFEKYMRDHQREQRRNGGAPTLQAVAGEMQSSELTPS
ncbi:putative bifunctional diguanylate cyclase/phosphodiesterase [Halioglobus maricola]|uniref:putative bifunctional diguanylate cyclase/phosphodiesterase n=1 Tax=Halioglobus maricola TaxID=2601894 RepID=UPI00147954C5|nr:EAL domain-containing protein [Halioglobus maricola]